MIKGTLIEGKTESIFIVYLYVYVESHLGRDKTIQKISGRFLKDIRILQHDKCQRTIAKLI